MTTTQITTAPLTEENELYCHYYPSQPIQECHLTLDLEDGELGAQYNPEPGNSGMPASVWNGRTRWYTLPGPLTNDAANELIEEAKTLAQRILDGSSIEWDGNNHVGQLNHDAAAAEEALRRLIETYDDNAAIITELDAADWFAEGDTPVDTGQLSADTTDEQLTALDAELTEDAKDNAMGPVIITGMDEYLWGRREELRQDLADRLGDVADEMATLRAERDALIRRLTAWSSSRQVGELAGLSHTQVQRITGSDA